MTQYRQLWHNHANSYHKEVPIGKAEVVVRSLYSFVSTGTERSMISTKQLSSATAMKMAIPYMEGQLGQDFTYGYSLVGEVLEGPDELVGYKVHLLHPHQEYAFVSSADAHIIPVGIDPKHATLASNLETAVNALWDSEIKEKDSVLIVGYGLIGALVARLCKDYVGTTVTVSEPNQVRATMAKSHGFELLNKQPSKAYDVSFHTSGTSKGLQSAIDQVGKEGKIIELSWYADREVTLRLGDGFHYDRKQIISSQVSSIPKSKQHDWDYKKRKTLVFDLLSKIDFSYLIQKSVPFDQTPQFFNDLRRETPSELGIIIDYN